MCGFTKYVVLQRLTWNLSPSWHIPQLMSRGYAADAINQILKFILFALNCYHK